MSNEHSNTTVNGIEKMFLKNKDKNFQDPGAKIQVYVLNLLHRIANAFFFMVGLNHSVKGVLQGSACALSVHCPPVTHYYGAHALQHCLATPLSQNG